MTSTYAMQKPKEADSQSGWFEAAETGECAGQGWSKVGWIAKPEANEGHARKKGFVAKT